MLFVLFGCGAPDPSATGAVDCAAGYWTPAGTLATPHYEHLTTVLPDGGALVAGGHGVTEAATNTYYAVEESEVWDPRTEAWHAAGPVDPPGFSLGGLALPDGRVLIAGYPDWDGENNHVAFFDSGTEVWTPSARAPQSWLSVPVLLADGRTLAVGVGSWEGELLSAHAEVLIFDPDIEVWTAAAPLSQARQYGAGILLLADGTVLAAGGTDSNGELMSAAERFDPATGVWRPTAPMNEPRANGLVLLDDGRVLASGGSVYAPEAGSVTAEVYDPDAETWTMVGSSSIDRHFAPLSRLADGSVLVVGGTTNDSRMAMQTAERFDPATGEWSAVEAPLHPRALHGAVLLEDGSLLIAGGMVTSAGAFDVTAVLEAERFVCPPR